MNPVALRFLFPAAHADDAPEREHLAALMRQIELADRLANQLADQGAAAQQKRARYHFDYARLRADLECVRTGVRDYLVPQRAQPRDPVPLAGDYTRSNATPDKEAPSP
jgi:RAQPRD family integrative conjugative element protein